MASGLSVHFSMKEELVSLGDISKLLGINKSKLNYYAWLNLIRPIKVLGKTMIFNKELTVKRLNEIKKQNVKGKTLKEIAKEYANC